MKKPSYISRPSASSLRAFSIQSKTDIVRLAGDLVEVALREGGESNSHGTHAPELRTGRSCAVDQRC